MCFPRRSQPSPLASGVASPRVRSHWGGLEHPTNPYHAWARGCRPVISDPHWAGPACSRSARELGWSLVLSLVYEAGPILTDPRPSYPGVWPVVRLVQDHLTTLRMVKSGMRFVILSQVDFEGVLIRLGHRRKGWLLLAAEQPRLARPVRGGGDHLRCWRWGPATSSGQSRKEASSHFPNHWKEN